MSSWRSGRDATGCALGAPSAATRTSRHRMPGTLVTSTTGSVRLDSPDGRLIAPPQRPNFTAYTFGKTWTADGGSAFLVDQQGTIINPSGTVQWGTTLTFHFMPKVVRTLRTLHTFTGLMLFPWAVLYGVTGFLFNHAGLATAPAASRTITLSPHPVGPTDRQLEQSVMAAMDTAAGSLGLSAPYRLAQVDATQRWPYATFAIARDDTTWSADVGVDSAGRERIVLTRPMLKGRALYSWPTLAAWLTDLHEKAGYSAVSLNLAPGAPREAGDWVHAVVAAWGWPFAVDAMSVVLLFWGVSGYVMWWQYRTHRAPGAIVIACSLLTYILLAAGVIAAATT